MKQIKRKRSTKIDSPETDSGSIICHFHHFTATEISSIRVALLEWYDQNKRQLPWRELAKHPDSNVRSYSIWVSEVMAQQTQITTVIDYYNRWMKKWPTVADLARAKLDEVNKLWSGLGYYSRAKRLLEGAQTIDQQLGGQMPQNAEDLKKLPGVGRYTACAISSIAYGEVNGVVDGNVVRVLTRLRVVGAEPNCSEVNNWLWHSVDQMVDKSRPGDFNQSLMELGALICTPKSPSCKKCPIQSHCWGNKQHANHSTENFCNDTCKSKQKIKLDIEHLPGCRFCLPKNKYEFSLGVENYPHKSKMKTKRNEHVAVAVLYRMLTNANTVEYFIVQRPNRGLLANLWEFPNVVVDPDISNEARIALLVNDLKELFGGSMMLDNARFHHKGQVLHIFSHIRCIYTVFAAELQENFVCKISRPFLWITKLKLEKSAISTAMRKVFKVMDKEIN